MYNYSRTNRINNKRAFQQTKVFQSFFPAFVLQMCRYKYTLAKLNEPYEPYRGSPYEPWTVHDNDENDSLSNDANIESMLIRFVPRVTRVRVFSTKNEQHRRLALNNIPYVIPYHLVQVRINFIFDFYLHRVIEVNPIDWETVLNGRVNIFSYGILSTDFVHETYRIFYRCAFWSMCSTPL